MFITDVKYVNICFEKALCLGRTSPLPGIVRPGWHWLHRRHCLVYYDYRYQLSMIISLISCDILIYGDSLFSICGYVYCWSQKHTTVVFKDCYHTNEFIHNILLLLSQKVRQIILTPKSPSVFYIYMYVYMNTTTTTTTQCKLQNQCSFACVCILVYIWLVVEKHYQSKLQWAAAGWIQVMCAPLTMRYIVGTRKTEPARVASEVWLMASWALVGAGCNNQNNHTLKTYNDVIAFYHLPFAFWRNILKLTVASVSWPMATDSASLQIENKLIITTSSASI